MNLRLRITIASLVSVLLVSIGLMLASEMISSSWNERFESANLRGNSVLWKKLPIVSSILWRLACLR